MNPSTYTALIVDDEAPGRDLIKAYLKQFPNITVVGECANGFDALKSIQELHPQILFLDVQMPKITGLELLEVLDNPPAVVFTTAYDQYALRAFEMSAVDYLLKPFSEQRFAQAVDKLTEKLQLKQPLDIKELMEARQQNGEPLTRVVVKTGSKMVVIPIDDIKYIEAQEDFVLLHTSSGRHSKTQTMAYYETSLPATQFVRIHRSYLVNINAIVRLEAYDKDSYVAVMGADLKLKVSRNGYKKLRETLRF
jgi:two-component system LytT family response regulator